jgi:hypothetical protein
MKCPQVEPKSKFQEIMDWKPNKDCYQAWRESHELLTAKDLKDGLEKDAQVKIPLNDIENLVQQYGGPMSLSTFVRMVSNGRNLGAGPTADETSLAEIAGKLHGKKWDQIIFQSTSVDAIMLRFEQEGIHVSEQDIRLLTSKLGRLGLVSALKARMKQNRCVAQSALYRH